MIESCDIHILSFPISPQFAKIYFFSSFILRMLSFEGWDKKKKNEKVGNKRIGRD